MTTDTLALPVMYRRRRAFFLLRATQHVKSSTLLPELARAVLALAVLAAWGGLAVFLAG